MPLRLSVMAGTAMGVEEMFENASEIDRRLVHREVAAIRDEGELCIREPGPQRFSQMLLLKTGKILTPTDHQHRGADLGSADLLRKVGFQPHPVIALNGFLRRGLEMPGRSRARPNRGKSLPCQHQETLFRQFTLVNQVPEKFLGSLVGRVPIR